MAATDFRQMVIDEAVRQGVDPQLALIVAQLESGVNQNTKPSTAGARGGMQLMPDTARGLGVNPDIPAENARGGVTYLKQMGAAHPGNTALQLASYNAGPGAVKKYGGIPLYQETRNYVLRALTALLSPRSAEAATLAPDRGQELADLLFKGQSGAAPSSQTPPGSPVPQAPATVDRGQELADLLFKDAQPTTPPPDVTAALPDASPVAPLPETPGDVRNPLAPGSPTDGSRLQQLEAERLLAHEANLQQGARAAREEVPVLGARQVMTPAQEGLPVEKSTANPLNPPAAPRATPAITSELSGQGYGDIHDAFRTGQSILPWLKARMTQPAVWRQAMDTGARVATGYATGGAPLAVQAGGQMLTEALTQGAGLQPKSVARIAGAGLTETAGNMAAPVALKVFQNFLRMTRGSKQLLHATRMGDAATTERMAREVMEAATEDSQSQLQTARSGVEAIQAEGQALGKEASLQSRELRAVRPGVMRGIEDQLEGKGQALTQVGERLQGAIRGSLGRLGAARSEALMRRVGNFGPEISEEAVNHAYRQLDDVQRLSVNPRALHEAVDKIRPAVRDGMQEALSILPDAHQGITFSQLRTIQTGIGKNIRSLERSIARGMDDLNGPVRLDALKRVYASTFQVLDDTMKSRTASTWKKTVDGVDELVTTKFPPQTKQLLAEANTLNRVVSMMDRVETMWSTKAISIVGGQEIFDADKLLRAIKGDAFLTRMLQEHNLLGGLTNTLGEVAKAQKTKFKAEGISVAGLQRFNQQLGREEGLRDITRTRAGDALQADTQQQLAALQEQMAQGKTVAHRKLGEIAQRLRETEARIELETPAQQSASIAGDIAKPLIVGAGIAGVTGRPSAGIGIGALLASAEGLGRFLLSKQGQRALERLFAQDPTLTMPKIGFLLNAATSGEDALGSSSRQEKLP